MKGDELQQIENRRERVEQQEDLIEAVERLGLGSASDGKKEKTKSGGGIFSKILKFFKDPKAGIMGIVTSIKSFGTFILGGIKTFGSIISKIALPITIAVGIIGGIFGAIKGFKEEGFVGGLKGFITGALDAVVGSLIGILNSIIKGLFSFLGLGELGKKITDVISSVFSLIKGTFTNFIDLVSGLFTGDFGKIKEALMNQFKLIGTALKDLFIDLPLVLGKALLSALKFIVIDIPLMLAKGIFNALKILVFDLPKFLIEKLIEGITSLVSALNPVNIVKNIGGKVASFFGFGKDEDTEEPLSEAGFSPFAELRALKKEAEFSPSKELKALKPVESVTGEKEKTLGSKFKGFFGFGKDKEKTKEVLKDSSAPLSDAERMRRRIRRRREADPFFDQAREMNIANIEAMKTEGMAGEITGRRDPRGAQITNQQRENNQLIDSRDASRAAANVVTVAPTSNNSNVSQNVSSTHVHGRRQSTVAERMQLEESYAF